MSDSSFTAPSLTELGNLLPAYDIEAFIAEGGMGAVYKARQRSLHRDVAIKVLPSELGADPAFRSSFETEARAMARLNHPNLISVFDSGETAGLLYIVMEYIPGKSLFHSAHNRNVDPVQAADLVAGICQGLAHAHDNGIIHRDVKPANILLTPKRQPKLGDFGLARQAGPTSQGLAMGTPGYTAPEVTQNPDNADRRSDIFAAGVILYELLTGKSPEPKSPPPSKVAGSDPALDVIWKTATQPDPADRYPSAAAMASALEMWKHSVVGQPAETSRRKRRKNTTKLPANWSLARNLTIIAVLIVGIAITWREYQRVQAERLAPKNAATKAAPAPAPDATNPAPPPEPEKPDEPLTIFTPPEEEPELSIFTAPDSTPTSETPTTTESSSPTDTPAQSLLRLRQKLISGDRDEMPVGTLQHGDSDYFHVTFPMTWPEARRFAKSFGGHIAMVKSAADLDWISAQIPDAADPRKSSFWLSTSKTLTRGWLAADATAWPLKSPPRGEGKYAAINRTAEIHAETDSATHPFLIQWHRNGKNPADLAEILPRTASSLTQTVPLFPHDTVAVADRHVLIVSEPITATRARELAELGGGHLYVPSTQSEADWIMKAIAKINAPDGLWIGANREGMEWKWNTGESWTFAQWTSESPSGNGTALTIIPNEGWADKGPAELASGYVIEWSNPPISEPTLSTTSTTAELREKAGALILTLDQRRQAALAKNVKSLTWDLDVWLRDNNKGEILRWKPGVEFLKKRIRRNRIPSRLPKVSDERFPARMLKLVRDAGKKEDAVDLEFLDKVATIRDAYVERLAAIRDAEFDRGQIDLARNLADTIKSAADTNKWAESFEKVVRKIDTSLPPITVISAIYGSGGKDADVTDRVTELIEKEQRNFWVNPGDLGADPNPGWNKGLTIVFQIDGKKDKKWWGENNEVKLSEFSNQ